MKWSLMLCFVTCATAAVLPKDDPIDESQLTTADIITSYGYPVEEHKVQTDDGYILSMFRVPYGKQCGPEKSKGPVLVMHGLFCSSTDWVILGPEKSIAFLLADACYDVWLGNNRGNTFSRQHVSLSDKDSEFWQFSWHQMGQYDTKALIDVVLHKSGASQLYYIGHSQGTTQFFIFNSLHPEYDAKVKGMFALAPIVFLGHSDSFVLQTISIFQAQLNWVTQMIGMDQFMPSDGFISQISQAVCKDTMPGLEAVCSNILFLACGFDAEQMNMTALPHILTHVPAGASTKQLLHYAQGFNTGEFRQFDYGSIKNMFIYGQLNPPKYDLSKNTIKAHLYYSYNDWLANTKDVDILKNNLGNIVEEYIVPFAQFNHMDYMWANDVDALVFNPIIETMDRESSQ